jgi:hypothetical protein
MVQLSRRELLRLTLGAGLLAASGYLFKDILRPADLAPGEEKTLAALLDTLIPADDVPGALQFGVAEKIQEKATTDRQYRRLVKRGCSWLEKRSKKLHATSFASLGEKDRDEILTMAAEAAAGSMQRIFFQQLRTDAFYYYYSHPGSWPQLGYDGPPQPGGFPDYAAAPAHNN